MQFSEKLKEVRKSSNYTQKDVYTYLKTSANGYASYEQGRTEPNLDTLSKLADFFNCSVDYLLGREDDFGNIVINSPAAPASELTSEERELVETFRAIPDNTKGVALTMLHSLAPAKKEKSTLNKRA